MKKFLLWMLLTSIFLVCSCNGIAEDIVPSNSIIIENLNDATEEELNSALQQIYAELQSRKESNVLIDDEYITANFLNFDEFPEMCFYVNLEITNKTNKTIIIMLDEASVNDESMKLVMTGAPVTILSGQKGEGSFIFMYQQLSIDSLSGVNTVNFRINILDESNMNIIEKTEMVSIKKNK